MNAPPAGVRSSARYITRTWALLIREGRVRATLLLTLTLGLVAAIPHGRTADAPLASAVKVGEIQGEVRLPAARVRRVLQRYDLGATASHLVQPIPAVAFVKGRGSRAVIAKQTQPATLAQQDTVFVPSVLVVQVGTVVEFPNQDPFFHNVFSYSPAKRFDLGRYPRGETKSVTFNKPGVVKVYCEVHKHMRSVIVVVENPFHALVDSTGHFRIRNIPAGRHEITIWTADWGSRTSVVDVPAGGTRLMKVSF